MSLTKFNVEVYGNLTKFSEVASLGRCRIFYQGENRNGGFITKEFAEQLISTIPYTPVKGIYDGFDYTDHGRSNDEGRIFGIVPKDYNLTWESHLDPDGITREYACVDIILYTEMYEEAKEIYGKSQSMELFPKTIQGTWQMVNGKRLFVYTHADFFGLQVLGDEVEPCFEGASFFSLKESFEDLINKIDSYTMLYNKKHEEDLEDMKINFKLSDNQKFDLLWASLNQNFTEEGNWTVEYSIVSVYDDYALVFGYETQKYERLYYTKNDDDTITLGERTECFIVDVTASEKAALDAIAEMNGGTYELLDQNFEKKEDEKEDEEAGKEDEEEENKDEDENDSEEDKDDDEKKEENHQKKCNNSLSDEEIVELNEKISTYEQRIAELESENATLTSERDNAIADYTNSNEQVEKLTNDINELNAYKATIEDAQKNEVLNKYQDKISAESFEKFSTEKANYSVSELEKELAFALVQNEPSIFNVKNDGIIPKNTSTEWDFLGKYEKH